MYRKIKLSSTVVLILLMLLVTVIPAFAKEGKPSLGALTFSAQLSGAEEVPPVKSEASGLALFRFNRTLERLDYKLAVLDIQDVFAAHIHCAPAGANGPVGVTLFMGGPVSPDGLLARARVTAPDEGNNCGWETLADVYEALKAGNGYVNVHTLAHPSGEIRGQIH